MQTLRDAAANSGKRLQGRFTERTVSEFLLAATLLWALEGVSFVLAYGTAGITGMPETVLRSRKNDTLAPKGNTP